MPIEPLRDQGSQLAFLVRRVGEIMNGDGVTVHVTETITEAAARVTFVYSDETRGTLTRSDGALQVSLGKADKGLTRAETIALMGKVVKALEQDRYVDIGIDLGETGLTFTDVMLGLRMALLKAGEFKTKKPTYEGIKKIRLLEGQAPDKDSIRETLDLGNAVNVARWLGMMPTNILGMHTFPDLLAHLFRGRRTSIPEPSEEAYAKMGLLNAVAAASEVPGRVMSFTVTPGSGKSDRTVTLVGKTLVYDSGGLCLKPKGGKGMKYDCGGGCALVGIALWALRNRDKLAYNVHFVWGIADNAIGPKAYRPGDVLWGYSGKSVEVDNTDAEGRLVLADAAAWACEKKAPDLVMPICTLTGGAMVAGGSATTTVMYRETERDPDLMTRLVRLGTQCGEAVNCLTVTTEPTEILESKIADMQNSGGGRREAAAQQGFAFISAHVPEEAPVLELDIAGRVDTGSAGVPNDAGVLLATALLHKDNAGVLAL